MNEKTLPSSRWDSYFLQLATAIGTNSRCLSRQIGALLTRDKSIISTGYNGPARGVPHCYEREEALAQKTNPITCPRKRLGYTTGQGLHLCLAVHAEVNTIVNAARNGVSSMGCSLYLSGGILPCVNCMSAIINAGVVEVVVFEMIFYDDASKYIIDNSNVIVRDYKGNRLWQA